MKFLVLKKVRVGWGEGGPPCLVYKEDGTPPCLGDGEGGTPCLGGEGGTHFHRRNERPILLPFKIESRALMTGMFSLSK